MNTKLYKNDINKLVRDTLEEIGGKELTVPFRIKIFILELYIQELGRIIDKLLLTFLPVFLNFQIRVVCSMEY
jgi:hypothetical protein